MFQYAVAMHQDRPRCVIDRPVFNLPEFDREYDKRRRQFPVGEKVKKIFRYIIPFFSSSAQSTPTTSATPCDMNYVTCNSFVRH